MTYTYIVTPKGRCVPNHKLVCKSREDAVKKAVALYGRNNFSVVRL